MGPNEPAGVADEINRAGKGSLVAWSVPGTVLLIALWIGLVGGFLDLGVLILKQHLTGDRFFRLGDHFFWLIPAGDTVLIVVSGLFLAVTGLVWRGAGFLRIAVAMLTFIGILNATARLPLAPWSVISLSAGVAVQAGRWAVGGGRRCNSFGWLVRRTTPLLAGGLLSLILIWFGERVWSECKVKALLPSAPTTGRNVFLIVWDTVRTNNLSLYGYGRRRRRTSISWHAKAFGSIALSRRLHGLSHRIAACSPGGGLMN